MTATAPQDAARLAEAVRSGDRRALARAITLIESTRADHRATADALLAQDVRPAGDAALEREDGESKGRYRLVLNGVEAEMTYSRAGDGLIIIDHTDVPAALRGRKVGERLVQRAIEDARRDHVSIIPLCPFAKAQIMRHPEWQDVLQG